jgi:transposase InsO family protein
MPWKETTAVSERLELVELAAADGANLALLCRRFGVSRKTAYKWVERYRAGGAAALADRSRRPAASPARTPAAVEARAVELRRAHPAWGGRKIAARLRALGVAGVPAPSTVTRILRDAGLLDPARSASDAGPWRRFEHPAPNDLWQMDFKGHVPLGRGGRLHPLTVVDDHSRYAVALAACGGESGEAVKQHLIPAFRRYGLPRRVLADNGAPWGNCGVGQAVAEPWSRFAVWLLRLGVAVAHGRPGHPQTQGKDERFNRTLAAEVLRWRTFADLAEAQPALDAWRRVYNHERPHDALALAVPAARYRPSPRPYPEALPPVEYPGGGGEVVRRVRTDGRIKFGGRMVPIGTAFTGEPVALRPTRELDGVWDVYYCASRIGQVDRREPAPAIRPPRPLAPLAPAAGGEHPGAPPMSPNTCNP